MAVPELDLARIRTYCDTRIPSHLREEARIDATVRANSVTISDCRPPWHPNLTEWSKMPVAQLRYQPGTAAWTLYWADRNGRWHLYDDLPPDRPVQTLIDEINDDPTAIFWG